MSEKNVSADITDWLYIFDLSVTTALDLLSHPGSSLHGSSFYISF